MTTIHNSTLLVDGSAAFDEILSCIDAAQSSISINMFIWRDDTIGNKLARAVLQAADRGVHVTISIDRVGMVLERCEESERSFFHTTPNIVELFKIWFLRISYPANRSRNKSAQCFSELPQKILSHPNITVDKNRQKNDHSKYYIFDDRILIFGGINVEDKECGSDCAGRVYQDYMLKLEGAEHVRAFLDKLEQNRNTLDAAYCFRMNNKTLDPAVFEMQECFLSIINSAQKELVIVMAYFAPVPAVVQAIIAAWKRGVHIQILIPEHANFQNNSNRRTMRILMKRSCNEIQVFLSPKMVHTKLIYSENTIMFGSCNITNRAFRQLDEVDIELKNDNTPLTNHIKESVAENLALSELIYDYRQIGYIPAIAYIESLLN